MKVVKLRKNKVCFEDNSNYDINIDLIVLYKLKEGLDLPFEIYIEFLRESCLLRAYKTLGRRDYSRKELFYKLNNIYKDIDIVESVLDRLEEKGYIDEYEYTKNYINNRKKGRRCIEYELKSKGIDTKIIKSIFDITEKDEKKEIKSLLYKVKKKEYKKKVEFFLRKGYKLEDILDIIKEED